MALEAQSQRLSAEDYSAFSITILSTVRLVRDGFARLLAIDPNVRVALSTPLVGKAFERVGPNHVVLVDASTITAESVSLAHTEMENRFVVVGLPTNNLILRARWIVSGAHACLSEDASAEELSRAVSDVARNDGSVFSPPIVTRHIVMHTALTKRECEVVSLLEQGKSNKQIALALGIQLSTAKNHVHNILRKSGRTHREQVGMSSRITGL